MKNLLLVILMVIFSQGCVFYGGMPKPDLDGCSTLDCIKDRVDDVELDPKYKYSCMEGYRYSTISELEEFSALEVYDDECLVATLGAIGMAPLAWTEIYFGPTGDIGRVEVHYCKYTPFINQVIAHELIHARGFLGSGHGQDVPRTEHQESVIGSEGVKYWYETSEYKKESPRFHDSKYWMKKIVLLCPVCGMEQESLQRVHGDKPEDPGDRIGYGCINHYCWV